MMYADFLTNRLFRAATYLPQCQQAVAPQHDIGVGGVLQMKVEGIGRSVHELIRGLHEPLCDILEPVGKRIGHDVQDIGWRWQLLALLGTGLWESDSFHEALTQTAEGGLKVPGHRCQPRLLQVQRADSCTVNFRPPAHT